MGKPAEDPDPEDDKKIIPLDEDDIALLKTYGLGPYSDSIKGLEVDLRDISKKDNDLCGIKESDTGLAQPSSWDLTQDKQAMQEEQPLQVARCTKIINPGTDDAQYVINVKQIAKCVVGLGQHVAPTVIEEGMRVGVDRTKYFIHIPLPAKIDPTVTMMTVEEKPDVTYADVGGSKEQIEKMREVVELPMLHPEKFVQLGIDPPGACYATARPGRERRCSRARWPTAPTRASSASSARSWCRSTWAARAWCASSSRWRGARRPALFSSTRWTPSAARFDDGQGGQRGAAHYLEIVNQLDGSTLAETSSAHGDESPGHPGSGAPTTRRLDRKVEFGLPDLESRTQIFRIHTRSMAVERDVRYELLSRLCPNATGAEIHSVCTEAGMFAIRQRRKTVNEKDSSTPSRR